MEKAKSEFIQNNYFVNFSGGYDDSDNSEPWKTTAHPDGTARDYVSKETLEENR